MALSSSVWKDWYPVKEKSVLSPNPSVLLKHDTLSSRKRCVREEIRVSTNGIHACQSSPNWRKFPVKPIWHTFLSWSICQCSFCMKSSFLRERMLIYGHLYYLNIFCIIYSKEVSVLIKVCPHFICTKFIRNFFKSSLDLFKMFHEISLNSCKISTQYTQKYYTKFTDNFLGIFLLPL